MDWKKWSLVKILGVISILILILLVIWVKIALLGQGPDAELIAFIISSWYILVIIMMWGLSFLTRYLIKREKNWIANTISIIGLLVFSGFLSLILILAITKPSFFNSWRTLFDIGGFIFFSGWAIISIIYFIISLIWINKPEYLTTIGALVSRKHEKIKSKTIEEFETEKKPSNWWYLLPIFLSIIGGVIGYFLFRNKDKKFAKRLLIIGIIILVIEIILQIILGILVYLRI